MKFTGGSLWSANLRSEACSTPMAYRSGEGDGGAGDGGGEGGRKGSGEDSLNGGGRVTGEGDGGGDGSCGGEDDRWDGKGSGHREHDGGGDTDGSTAVNAASGGDRRTVKASTDAAGGCKECRASAASCGCVEEGDSALSCSAALAKKPAKLAVTSYDTLFIVCSLEFDTATPTGTNTRCLAMYCPCSSEKSHGMNKERRWPRSVFSCCGGAEAGTRQPPGVGS